jgi:hypothetical protein
MHGSGAIWNSNGDEETPIGISSTTQHADVICGVSIPVESITYLAKDSC